jgi:hypothetical protein
MSRMGKPTVAGKQWLPSTGGGQEEGMEVTANSRGSFKTDYDERCKTVNILKINELHTSN